MKKKITAIFLTLLMVLSLSISVYANGEENVGQGNGSVVDVNR